MPGPGPVEDLDDGIGPNDLHRFLVVLRGYDRIEVDECLRRIAATVDAVRAELNAEQQARRELERRSADPSGGPRPGPPADSFGARAERLLRLADTEAREIRLEATREAGAQVEQARSDAERIRHDAEQEFIARSTRIEQEIAARLAELQEREQHVADKLSELGAEADAVREAAQRDIAGQKEQARAEIAEARRRAEADRERAQQDADRELHRRLQIGAEARTDLQRLLDVLREQLDPSLEARDVPRSGR